MVNHAASVLMAEELDLGADGRLELGEEGLNFTGAELTVREFMEEQQQKRSGLIHGDSDHIAVDTSTKKKAPKGCTAALAVLMLPDLSEQPENVQRPGNEIAERGMPT